MRHHLLALPLTLLLVSCVHFADSGPPDMQTMKESRPLGNAKELSVRLNYDIGALEGRSSHESDLFSFNLDYDARRVFPRFNFDEGERATVTLSANSHGGFHGSDKR